MSTIADKDALKGTRFGMPWKRIWERASLDSSAEAQYQTLQAVISRLRAAGAEVIKVEIPSAEGMVPRNGGWGWYELSFFLIHGHAV